MKTPLFFSLVLCFFYANAQPQNQHITYNAAHGWGTAKNVSQQEDIRQVGSFESIAIAGPFKVTLNPGKESEVVLRGASKSLELIETKVEGGTLKIGSKPKVKFQNMHRQFRNIKIFITVDEIDGLSLSGSGKITSEQPLKAHQFSSKLSGSGSLDIALDAQKVEAKLSGSGKIVVRGHTKKLILALSGSGKLDAQNMESNAVEAKLSGSGRIYACPLQSLDVNISGSGIVKFCDREQGQNIRSNVVGSGKVISGF